MKNVDLKDKKFTTELNDLGRMDRRTFVKLTGIAAGAVAFGTGLSRLIPSAGASPQTTPFQVPLPMPQVLTPYKTDSTTDYYQITMKEAQVQILPGLNTTIWGYNGLYPGPTIMAKSGRRVVVTQTNNLTVPTTVHLHGGHVPADSDGYPTDYIMPGSSKTYTYPNNEPAVTHWYHDHTLDFTGRNVYMGLAAFYIIQDDFESGLNLPSGNYDIPLVIQDRLFNSDGSLFYPPIDQILKDGFMGDTILVNGAVQPYLQVAKRKYRFRILNGSNARAYELALSTNSRGSSPPFIQIGTDGGLLPAPATRSKIAIWPAERADVVIDFSAFAVGTQVILKNNFEYGSTGDIMRFDIVRKESDTSTVPSTLRPVTPLPNASVTRNFELDFDRDLNLWVINGKPFDPSRIDASPRLGATEIWRFINRSHMAHPIHIHHSLFQILDRGGKPPAAYEAGWKDTVVVDRDDVRIKIQFLDYTGKYPFHCHIVEHEDYAMMGQFEVVP